MWSMVNWNCCYEGKQKWCSVQFMEFFAVWKLGYMYSIDETYPYYMHMYMQNYIIKPDYTGHVGWLVPQSLGSVGKLDLLPIYTCFGNEWMKQFFVEPLTHSKFIAVPVCCPSYIINWKREKDEIQLD